MNENDENQVGGAASDLANTIDRARRLLALATEEMQYAQRLAGVGVPQETVTDTWGRTWTAEALMEELGKRTESLDKTRRY